jgi:LemA protein
MIITYTILSLILGFVLFALWWIITYNKFIAGKNRVKQAESTICVMLKQRNDMIPNWAAADKQFLRLEKSIEEMEYQLQAARQTFNAAAVRYNNRVQMFPSSMVASVHRYRCYELITFPEAEKANVDVKSLFRQS